MARLCSSFSFLCQALLLPSKNPKLFSKVLLIYIISHAFLYISLQLSIKPLISELNEIAKLLPTIDPTSPEFIKLIFAIKAVTNQMLIDEVVYFVFLFVVSSFLSIIFYYLNSATYLGEILTLRELLNKVKGIIKGPIITQIFVAFLGFTFFVIFGAIGFAISWYLSTNNYKISSWFITIPLILLGTLPLAYLAIIWSMGVAISVIEPDIYGISAISHATKLLKGKKMQVFLLFFTLSITSGIIYVFNTIIIKFVSGSKAGSSGLGFVYQLLHQVVTLYSMMAVTVLYYECNSIQSNGGVGNKDEYTQLLASTSVV